MRLRILPIRSLNLRMYLGFLLVMLWGPLVSLSNAQQFDTASVNTELASASAAVIQGIEKSLISKVSTLILQQCARSTGAWRRGYVKAWVTGGVGEWRRGCVEAWVCGGMGVWMRGVCGWRGRGNKIQWVVRLIFSRHFFERFCRVSIFCFAFQETIKIPGRFKAWPIEKGAPSHLQCPCPTPNSGKPTSP